MATKTITLDLEAYRRLSRARRDGESFSEVVKRVVPEPVDVKALLRKIRSVKLSDDYARAVEDRIAARRRPTARRRSA